MGSGRLRGAVLTAAVTLLLLTASSASAAITQPIDLGDAGDHPNVTLRPDGTADLVWDGDGQSSGQLTYCQLPPTATTCSVKTLLPTGGSDSLVLPIAIGSGST